MQLDTLKILATIFIALVIIKLIVVSISPKSWFDLARKIYVRPKLTSIIALILALIVLYLILNSWVTIVEILAVTLFLSLLIMVGVAQYANELLQWKSDKDLVKIARDQWLYILIWIVLLIWGIKAIYFWFF